MWTVILTVILGGIGALFRVPLAGSCKPEGAPRQLWGSAPAPPRARARHHSSCVTLRLRFNLPQPGVSIIRAAPHFAQ